MLVKYAWLVLRLKHTLAYNHSYCWFISTLPGIILAHVNWHSLKQCLGMVWKFLKFGTVSSWYFKAECFALIEREQSSVGMTCSMPFDTGPRQWAFAILFTLNSLRDQNQKSQKGRQISTKHDSSAPRTMMWAYLYGFLLRLIPSPSCSLTVHVWL